MRFDDRLATVLRFDPGTALGRAAIWRQMLDMVAQSGPDMTEAAEARGLSALAMLRDQVALDTRVASACSIAARCRSLPLAVFLAHDAPPVAVAFTDRLQLTEADWLSLLPDIGPLGRSRLRARADLPSSVTRALESFGSTDFTLAAPTFGAPSTETEAQANPETRNQAGPMAEPTDALYPEETGAGQSATTSHSDIANLVQRIEAYRIGKASNDDAPMHGSSQRIVELAAAIAFRTDSDGHVRAVQGADRGSFVGLTLAEAARSTDSGFDAGVARAFAKRAPVRSGRLWLTGDGLYSGHWLIDADPRFDRHSGRFQGYEGSLRRSNDALLAVESGDPDGGGYSAAQTTHLDGIASSPIALAEGMRQMVHELRSPLNAINGFAELIEGQFFGPVSHHYRQLAQAIMRDAAQLAGAFDDFDVAARLDMGLLAAEPGECDMQQAIGAAMAAVSPTLAARGSSIELSGVAALTIAVAQGDARRILVRFLAALAQQTGAGQHLVVLSAIDVENSFASLQVDRISELDAVDMNGEEVATDDPSGVIGIDFTMRLLDRVARLYGGSLIASDNQFILNLPLAHSRPDRIGSAV